MIPAGNISGNVLAVVVTDIGDKQPLLKHELTTGKVLQPGVAQRPPGDVPIEMGSRGGPLVARLDIQIRLVDVEAEHIASEPRAESQVAHVLQHVGIFLPVRPHRGICLGLHVFLAVYVRGRRGLLDRIASLELVSVPEATGGLALAGPELAHGNIALSQALKRVDPMSEERPSGLGVDAHSMLA